MKKFFALFHPKFNNEYSYYPMSDQVAIYKSAKKRARNSLLISGIILCVGVISMAMSYFSSLTTDGRIILDFLFIVLLGPANAWAITFRYRRGYYGDNDYEARKILEDARRQK